MGRQRRSDMGTHPSDVRRTKPPSGDARAIADGLLADMSGHPLGISIDRMRAAAIDLLTRERDADDVGPDTGVRWLLTLTEACKAGKPIADEGWVAVQLRRAGLIGMDVHAYWLRNPPLGREVAALLSAPAPMEVTGGE